MFYCCLFHLCFPPNVHHFCRRILNSIVLKFCIPVRISQNGIVLIDSFPIIRIFRAFVNPFLLFGLHFYLFFFTSFLPIIFLCAIYPPSKTCYTLCTRPPTANWENLAVTSYQYRAVSACITDALHAFYMPWHIRAVACGNLQFHASAHHWHVSAFCVIGNSFGIF